MTKSEVDNDVGAFWNKIVERRSSRESSEPIREPVKETTVEIKANQLEQFLTDDRYREIILRSPNSNANGN